MDYIGKYTKQYESGNLGSLAFGNCGNDWGLSCGSYQLTLRWGNCITFLKKYFPNEAQKLYYKGPDIQTPTWPGPEYSSSPEDVKQIWIYCYNQIGNEQFFKYEHEYMKNIYYNPIKQQISSYIDLDNTSRAFQECFWSWSIHRGPIGAFDEFKSAIFLKNLSTINHEKLFDLLYDKRYQKVPHNRYKKGYENGERETLRKLLDTPGLDVSVITSPSIIQQKGENIMSKMKYTDANPPKVCMMTNSTCYKQTTEMQVVGVLFHSTGANNPTLKRYVQPSPGDPNYDELIQEIGKNLYNNSWNQITHYAGLNAWIGKMADGSVTTLQTLPWTYRPWGCGTGKKGSCNTGWIQFEICEDQLNDKAYFKDVYTEAIELTAYLCKKFNIDPHGQVEAHDGSMIPTILCHADSYKLGFGSNHGDVNHWFPKFGKSMESVRNDVAELLKEDAIVETPVITPTPIPPVVETPVVNTSITQEQFNQMMDNYLNGLAAAEPTWEQEALDWAVSNGLMQGDEHGRLMAKKFMTRGEIMTVLQRFKNKFCN